MIGLHKPTSTETELTKDGSTKYERMLFNNSVVRGFMRISRNIRTENESRNNCNYLHNNKEKSKWII